MRYIQMGGNGYGCPHFPYLTGGDQYVVADQSDYGLVHLTQFYPEAALEGRREQIRRWQPENHKGWAFELPKDPGLRRLIDARDAAFRAWRRSPDSGPECLAAANVVREAQRCLNVAVADRRQAALAMLEECGGLSA